MTFLSPLLIFSKMRFNGPIIKYKYYMLMGEGGSISAYLPLGSVCFDHVGVHLMTVSAQYGGKCSSNINRYQYLYSHQLWFGVRSDSHSRFF